jgi:hypothetical protein
VITACDTFEVDVTSETSPGANPVTFSLKNARNLIGWDVAGSGYPAAWLMATVGLTLSTVIELSTLVEGRIMFPIASVTPPLALIRRKPPSEVKLLSDIL